MEKTLEKETTERMEEVQNAVQALCQAGDGWENKVGEELARQSVKERRNFIVWAASACSMLGDFIAAVAEPAEVS
jgi:hypothetical protein